MSKKEKNTRTFKVQVKMSCTYEVELDEQSLSKKQIALLKAVEEDWPYVSSGVKQKVISLLDRKDYTWNYYSTDESPEDVQVEVVEEGANTK